VIKVIEDPLQQERLDYLRSRLFQAFKNLDQATLQLLVRRFGLDGEDPLSTEDLAARLNMPIESVIQLEQEALRALIGNSKYKSTPYKKLVEQ
jgi:DNA-directed RNA polymerase sigma subunit (sigma70/sigma32)